MADISVPFAEASETLTASYMPRRVKLRLTGGQQEILKRVLAGLVTAEETLLDGRAVRDPDDALCWLLEETAANA